MSDDKAKAWEERFGVEIGMLKRLGMKWAVLTSLSHVLYQKGMISQIAERELQLTHNMIESGCFTVCDVEYMLTDVERELIPMVLSLKTDEPDKWMTLLGKAMKGELKPEEVMELPFIEPLIQNTEFLQCAAGKERWF